MFYVADRVPKGEDLYSRIPLTVEEKNMEMIEEEMTCRDAALEDDQVAGLKLKAQAQRYGGVTGKWRNRKKDQMR